jgi:ABC-type multidrug transport system fused ATPase/permease subunit
MEPIREFVMLSIAALLILIHLVLVKFNAGIPLSSSIVFILLLRRSTAGFNYINNFQTQFAAILGHLDEIVSIFDDRDKFIVNGGTESFKGQFNAIEIKNLDFHFGKLPILKNLSLTFRQGETTAIVGHTGAGKSTVLNLLARFYDCPPATIFVDSIDLRSFQLESWWSRIAIVTQDSYLINSSLRENILYGTTRAVTEDELQSALATSHLDSLVQSLPDGLDTAVGTRGLTLSGGEKQRIAIARAILKSPEIIFLDEATSALDSITEDTIQKALRKTFQGKTIIVVAHRLSTIMNSDQVVVLDRGSVLEIGSPQTLLANKGKFSEYWQMQNLSVS